MLRRSSLSATFLFVSFSLLLSSICVACKTSKTAASDVLSYKRQDLPTDPITGETPLFHLENARFLMTFGAHPLITMFPKDSRGNVLSQYWVRLDLLTMSEEEATDEKATLPNPSWDLTNVTFEYELVDGERMVYRSDFGRSDDGTIIELEFRITPDEFTEFKLSNYTVHIEPNVAKWSVRIFNYTTDRDPVCNNGTGCLNRYMTVYSELLVSDVPDFAKLLDWYDFNEDLQRRFFIETQYFNVNITMIMWATLNDPDRLVFVVADPDLLYKAGYTGFKLLISSFIEYDPVAWEWDPELSILLVDPNDGDEDGEDGYYEDGIVDGDGGTPTDGNDGGGGENDGDESSANQTAILTGVLVPVCLLIVLAVAGVGSFFLWRKKKASGRNLRRLSTVMTQSVSNA
ncbi:hypothetical protein QOT17_016115 [Balamuthia mandrillaris]